MSSRNAAVVPDDRTDCVSLSPEDEVTVSKAITALQHILDNAGSVCLSPLHKSEQENCDGDSAGHCRQRTTGVYEYLGHFSYGLKRGECRYVMYRFLKANGMVIHRALEALTITAEFRKKQNLDRMALFPSLIPMKGYDERHLCKELGIPFIESHEAYGSVADVAERLLLRSEELDYYNVKYAELYGLNETSPSSDEDLSEQQSASVSDARTSEIRTREPDMRPTATTPGSHACDTTPACSEPRGGFFSSLKSVFFPSSSSGQGKASEETETKSEDYNASSSKGSLHPLQEDMPYMNTGCVGLARVANPSTKFADSMNFHGLLRPIIAVVTKHVQTSFHYWDREGRPVMYMRLGALHSKNLLKELFALAPLNAEPSMLAVLFVTYTLEVVQQLIRFCNKRNKKDNFIHDVFARQGVHETHGRPASLLKTKPPVGSCVVVLDCAGLRMYRYLHQPLLLMVKSIVKMATRQYPELLHHIYVTNCHTAVSWPYFMLRSVLPHETRRKVTFCSKNSTAAVLREVISSDLLPMELGGKCCCAGGCIPAPCCGGGSGVTDARSDREWRSVSSTAAQSEVGSQALQNALEEPNLEILSFHCTVERLLIGARRTSRLSFAMDAHSDIIWDFVVRKKSSISFSAVFVPATDDGEVLSMVPRRRVENDAGHFISPSVGTVVFQWSNKHSIFHSICVHLKVYRDEHFVTGA